MPLTKSGKPHVIPLLPEASAAIESQLDALAEMIAAKLKREREREDRR